MPVKITMARTPAETDAVLKLRHQVFSEEEGLFDPLPDKRVLDRFDAFSTTRNLIAVSEGEVVGSLRVTMDSDAGIPADEYYDFRRFLPEDAAVMNCSLYCVTTPFRGARIALGLMLMAAYYAMTRNVTHVVAPINPAIAKLLKRVGFKMLDEEQFDEHMGVTFIPVMLVQKDINDFFSSFAENNRLYNFMDSYECIFYNKGEYVVREGDIGDSAFVLIDGEVEVRRKGSDEVLAVMGQGEVFGELALLTDDVRSADVIARSELRIMSLPKEAFLDHLMNNPDHAMWMLKSIGQRMKSMLNRPG
ncbi:N-acyl amino acid synthase FeeM domain-containing protein [Oceanospirillum sediminis]|uniref:Cyclic nucleotide-binding domain-containing protein n=1 Tax=Oceanospirillum sediminis TaxID=2760088 RepID=A0A839IWQ3_9GAMM|nr:cyclic nucleotide-binding domain-containing protein [Oceanospirillum sediminis]MBB1489054.1 cyclic nucleotide-binding domain-containing protein [Oceanospirillum sediminis]